MNRRKFVGTMVLGVPATALAAEVQPPEHVARIGYFSPMSPTQDGSRVLDALREGLHELGYVEGRNITIESRWGRGRCDRLPDVAAELVRLKVDIIVPMVTHASLAAKKATSTIPIVMVGVGDPVGSGLVATLGRPGGNITGTSSGAPEVVGKQLELLKEAVPKVFRVAVLWNPANPVCQGFQVRAAEVAGRTLGMQLQFLEARAPDDLGPAFAAMTREGTRALHVLADPMFTLHQGRIVELAAKSRLPTVGGFREYAEAGGLMAYGPSYPQLHRRAAYFVDKILKGAKPADLPVEQPTKFELVINLKTAKALGLTIPQSLMLRADQVIE